MIIAGGSRVELDVVLETAPGTIVSDQPLVYVRIETAFGNIDLEIDIDRAPITAANFLKYVDGGFYNGGRFHRATRPDNYVPKPPNRPPMELIQGGINPDRRGESFPPIPLERTSVTGLKHVVGTVSMARGEPDSARSDFFILLNDQPSLDFGGLRFDDGQGAAAFGRVVAGLDVVRKIQQQPVKDQALAPPVTIRRVGRQGTDGGRQATDDGRQDREADALTKALFQAFAAADAAKMKDYFADKVLFVGDLRFLFGPLEPSASHGQVAISREELIDAYTKFFAAVGKEKWAALVKQVQPRLHPVAQSWKHPDDLQGQLPADFAKPGDYVYDLRVPGKTDLDDSVLFVLRPVNGKLLIVAHWADY